MKGTGTYVTRVAKIRGITLTVAVISPAGDTTFDKCATMEGAAFDLLRVG
jgi:hypothetical protein